LKKEYDEMKNSTETAHESEDISEESMVKIVVDDLFGENVIDKRLLMKHLTGYDNERRAEKLHTFFPVGGLTVVVGS
jgi:hypothetical protein